MGDYLTQTVLGRPAVASDDIHVTNLALPGVALRVIHRACRRSTRPTCEINHLIDLVGTRVRIGQCVGFRTALVTSPGVGQSADPKLVHHGSIFVIVSTRPSPGCCTSGISGWS